MSPVWTMLVRSISSKWSSMMVPIITRRTAEPDRALIEHSIATKNEAARLSKTEHHCSISLLCDNHLPIGNNGISDIYLFQIANMILQAAHLSGLPSEGAICTMTKRRGYRPQIRV